MLEDFESGQDGWESAGFVRIQNVLPQTFRLALIEFGTDTQVTYLELDPDNTLEIPLNIGGDVDEVVLVVTAPPASPVKKPATNSRSTLNSALKKM